MPYMDSNEEFSLNITPTEIETMKDASGDIHFHKVMEHLLPRFDNTEAGEQSLWEWQAARMRNYLHEVFSHAP